MVITPERIVDLFVSELGNCGYSVQTIHFYTPVLRSLLKYCKTRGIEQYDSSVGEAFLKERFSDIPVSETSKRRANTYNRAINMLSYFHAYNSIPFRFKEAKYRFPEWFEPVYNKFLEHRKYMGIQERTIWKQHYYFEKLALYLDKNGLRSYEQITLPILQDFVASLTIYSLSVRYNIVSAVRMFLQYLYENGYTAGNYKEAIPNVKYSHEAHVPSVYSQEEIQRLLQQTDRGNATGMRDYAILLLAARLGLRASDICQLSFDDIDWENNCIHIVQKKTGNPLLLPLSGEVGNAIICYIKHGRPKSASRNVFLRHYSPIQPIGSSSIHCMIQRYFYSAGIDVRSRKHGPHSLRHSLATNMLTNSTPLPTISEVLGHTSTASTQIYIKVDLSNLSKCALPLPGEEEPV